MTSPHWDLSPGDTLSRGERMDRFGGSLQGGIAHSSKTPNVFIYTDPDAGSEHGYNDYWDAAREFFFYSGEGQLGNQTFDKSPWGNRAIRDHKRTSRAIRLFESAGTLPNSDEVIQRYVGELEIDDTDPYTMQRGPDKTGAQRDVIVFKRRRVTEDAPSGTGIGTGDANRVEQHSDSVDSSTREAPEPPIESPTIRKIPVESQVAEDFSAEMQALGRKDRTRKEAKLQKRYERYLRKTLRHKVCRHEIRIDGQSLYTDLYDETADELIEVKSSNERNTMRLALGQVLDYAQVLKPLSCTVLVPEGPPTQGVVDLFHEHNVRLVWSDGDTFRSSTIEPIQAESADNQG